MKVRARAIAETHPSMPKRFAAGMFTNLGRLDRSEESATTTAASDYRPGPSRSTKSRLERIRSKATDAEVGLGRVYLERGDRSRSVAAARTGFSRNGKSGQRDRLGAGGGAGDAGASRLVIGPGARPRSCGESARLLSGRTLAARARCRNRKLASRATGCVDVCGHAGCPVDARLGQTHGSRASARRLSPDIAVRAHVIVRSHTGESRCFIFASMCLRVGSMSLSRR